MTIRAQLREICEATPGARACALMGFDGFAIDTFEPGPRAGAALDVPTLLAEYAQATQALRTTGQQQPQAGHIREVVVITDALVAVIQPLTPEFYVATLLAPEGTWGKARFLMRRAADTLREALA